MKSIFLPIVVLVTLTSCTAGPGQALPAISGVLNAESVITVNALNAGNLLTGDVWPEESAILTVGEKGCSNFFEKPAVLLSGGCVSRSKRYPMFCFERQYLFACRINE